MLPGLVVFTRSYSPDDIIRQIHDRRVSVLVCVPKILEVLRDHSSASRPRRRSRRRRCTGRRAGGSYRARAPPVRLQVLGDRRRRGAARSRARGVLGTAGLRRHSGLRPHRDGADRHAESSVPRRRGRRRQADRRRRDQDRRRRRDPRARRERDARLLQRAGGDAQRRSATAGSTPATSASSTTRDSCASAAARRR